MTTEKDVFGNAKWIGVPSGELPFNKHYLSVFDVEFEMEITSGDTLALLYGINDPRLLNPNENIFNLSVPSEESYIKIQFISPDSIFIYRNGYHPSDVPDIPLAKFKSADFKSGINKVKISSNSGITSLFVNDEKIGEAVVNPNGRGGDYLAFPVLADMAVEINRQEGNEACKSKIGNIRIKNHRQPRNIIYSIAGTYDESAFFELPVISMPELKTVIDIQEARLPETAEMIATARGVYDIYINGERVSEDYFFPGSTQYNKTHLYHTFDILPFLRKGANEITVTLGEGWWSGPATYTTENWNFFGDRQSFIATVDIRYEDGSGEIFITSPDSWEYSIDGPLLEASFFNGEVYDNTRYAESRKWNKAVEISIDSTVNRRIGTWDDIRFLPDFGDRVTAVDTIVAIRMFEPREGVYVYDMGQNFAGVPLIEFPSLNPGQQVNLKYAEILYPDMPQYEPNIGMIMTENLRAAMNKDSFIASGKNDETFSPRMTLHGYRYLEITGIDSSLPLPQVKGIVLSSIPDFKAHYECSDTLVNRLWNNILWSARSNFISIPTDCPQRNERLGWMGDISVFSPTATKLADVSPLLRQYLTSVRDCQAENGKYPDVAPTATGFGGLLWGSAGIIVPWEMYRQYKDLKTLEEHYPSMRKYIEYILRETIDPESGVIVQNHEWGDLGDWLSPEYEKNDKSLLWECYFIYDLEIMEKVARLLGKDDDARFYNDLKQTRVSFFADNYIDKETEKTIWSDYEPHRKGDLIDTQVSYALPIAFGIYNSPRFAENFKETITRKNIADDGTICEPYSLMTGFIGTAWISEALSKIGDNESAYRLLTNTSYPSWLYPVTEGATTIWERLNSYTRKDGFGSNNSMNSFNHYSFGAVGNWLLTHSLGINVSPDGLIEIAPLPDPSGNITRAKGWRDTDEGRIESSWKTEEGKTVLEVSIPEGKEGFLYFNEERIPLHSGTQSFEFPQ